MIAPELVAHVKLMEGFRGAAYRCPAGVWTIGYGYTHGVKAGDRISEAQATVLLVAELARVQEAVLGVSPAASGRRLNAIVDMAYNCGTAAYAGSTLRRAVNAGDWPEAARQNARWNRGGGRVLPGLVRRREVTSGWLLNG